MVSVGANNDASENYIYFVNTALAFGKLYGYYSLEPCKVIKFESKALACGESVTMYIPCKAYNIAIYVDVSYTSWCNVYKKQLARFKSNLCLLSRGIVGQIDCYELPCSLTIPSEAPPCGELNDTNLCNENCNLSKNDKKECSRMIYNSVNNSVYVANLHSNCNKCTSNHNNKYNNTVY